MNKKILILVINILAAGAVAIPLFMHSQFFFPFVVPKNVLFRVIVELMFALYIILIAMDKTYLPRYNKLVLVVSGFFGITLLATILSISFNRSFWGNYERMGGMIYYLHIFAYFIILLGVMRTKKEWHTLFTVSVFASMIMVFVSAAQFFKVPFFLESSGAARLTGTVGNAAFLAGYILFNIFFVFYFLAKRERFNLKLFALLFISVDAFLLLGSILFNLFPQVDFGLLNILKFPLLSIIYDYLRLQNLYSSAFVSILLFIAYQVLILFSFFSKYKNILTKILLLATLIALFLVLFNTQTRGALLGLYAGMIVLFTFILFSARNSLYKKISIFGLICLFTLPVFVYVSRDSFFVKNNGTLNRFANVSFDDITTQSRLLTWRASWQGFTETPRSFFLGYGPEQYYYVFNKNFPSEIYKDTGSQIWFDRAHNVLLDIATTTGVFGLSLYVLIFFIAIYYLYKNYKSTDSISLSWLFVALLTSFFIQNLFVFDTVNTDILFYTTIAFIAFSANEINLKSLRVQIVQNANLKFVPIYSVIVFVGLVFVVYHVNIKTLNANNAAFLALKSNNPEIKFELLKKSLFLGNIGTFEVREQISNVVLTAPFNKEAIYFAEQSLQQSIKEEPLNVRHYLTLAMFYNKLAAVDVSYAQRSIEVLKAGIPLSPTRPQLYFELGNSYILLGKTSEAQKNYEQGAALATSAIDGKKPLLGFYISQNKSEEADQLFVRMKNEGWVPSKQEYEAIIEAYRLVDNEIKIIQYVQEMERDYPEVNSKFLK